MYECEPTCDRLAGRCCSPIGRLQQRCVAIGRHKSGIDDTTHTVQTEAADQCDNSQQQFQKRIKHSKTSKATNVNLEHVNNIVTGKKLTQISETPN